MDERWLDRFVKMTQKQKDAAIGWVDFYEGEYPKCGTLKKWKENPDSWPQLSPEEQEAINAECIVM